MNRYTWEPIEPNQEEWEACADIKSPNGHPLCRVIRDNGDKIDFPVVPDDGESHHVVVKCSKGQIFKYIDGIEIH